MCMVSMVYDYGKKIPLHEWTNPETIKQFDILKKEAELFDVFTHQPDCDDPTKLEWLKTVQRRLKYYKLLEELAELEHIQWIRWTQSVDSNVPPYIVERWRKNWIPYNELPEEEKNKDREFADKIIAILEEKGILT